MKPRSTEIGEARARALTELEGAAEEAFQARVVFMGLWELLKDPSEISARSLRGTIEKLKDRARSLEELADILDPPPQEDTPSEEEGRSLYLIFSKDR